MKNIIWGGKCTDGPPTGII